MTCDTWWAEAARVLTTRSDGSERPVCFSALSVDRRPGAERRTPPQQKPARQAGVSVTDLTLCTRSGRVSSRHGNGGDCLAGSSGFWFETLVQFRGFSCGATSLTIMNKLQLHGAPFL